MREAMKKYDCHPITRRRGSVYFEENFTLAAQDDSGWEGMSGICRAQLSALPSVEKESQNRVGRERQKEQCLYILAKVTVLKMQTLNIINLIQIFRKSPKGAYEHTLEMPRMEEAQSEFQNLSLAQSLSVQLVIKHSRHCTSFRTQGNTYEEKRRCEKLQLTLSCFSLICTNYILPKS